MDEHLLYLFEHRLLICRACKHGISGKHRGLQRHLLVAHKDIPLKTRKDLARQSMTLEILEPSQLKPPEAGGLPIEGLEVVHGWVCDECSHACVSEGSMRGHCTVQHKWIHAHGPRWQTCYVQTFFQGPARNYFVVAPVNMEEGMETQDMTTDQCIQVMLDKAKEKDIEEGKETGVMDENYHAVDKTPWMRRTGWLRDFASRNMKVVAHLSQKPEKDEPELELIWRSVERVISRSMGGVEDCSARGWRLIPFWLNSSEASKMNLRPFDIDLEASTVKRYSAYWGRFTCYCLRILQKEEEEWGVQFTLEQEYQLRDLWRVAMEGEGDEDMMDSMVLQMSIKFIMHSDYTLRKSVLVHFLGVLGYDERTGRWREPSTYTPILAGMTNILQRADVGFQMCMRVLILEYALPTEDRDEFSYLDGGDPVKLFREVRDKWLVEGEGTPFDAMHKLLQYGMHVGAAAKGKDRVLWSEDKQTMFFDGHPLTLDGFRQFIHYIVQDAERTICESLMFGDVEVLAKLDLMRLRDNVNIPNINYSFIMDTKNDLLNGRERMMSLLKKSPCWRTMYKTEQGAFTWKAKGIRKYEWAVEKFLEHLLILIHITGGQPGRGTEITTLKYANSMGALRNVFIYDGQVMLVTEYHKSVTITDQLKVIPRFLPERVGKMLIIYLAYVLPFRQLLDQSTSIRASKGFIWFKRDHPWETSDLTAALTEQSGSRLNMRIRTSDYRHIAVAIDREHVRGLTEGLDPENEDAHDLQASHSTTTADRVYGIRGDILRSLTSRSIEVFKKVTDRWHQFLRLTPKGIKERITRIRSLSLSASIPVAKKVKRDLETEMQEALNVFLGAGAQYRSKEQRLGLKAVLDGESPLVVILPTGGGKSLLFMLPAWLEGARTTVVISPFVALANDTEKRCKEARIDCIQWRDGLRRRTKVVVVSAESAVSPEFMHYMTELYLSHQLDRVVLDECHLVITAAGFREAMHKLKNLAIPVPLILLTATLPPSVIKQFEKALAIQKPTYIRAATGRSNFAYSVEIFEKDMDERVVLKLQEIKNRLGTQERAVVFCRSTNQCEAFAEALKCNAYHARYKDKEAALASWIAGDNKLMIATGALGTGIDLKGISYAIHVGKPWSMIEYGQEIGRAGRDGEKVQAILMLSGWEYRKVKDSMDEELNEDGRWLKKYIMTEGCRQSVLREYFDGVDMVEDCDSLGGERCQACTQTEGLISRFKPQDYYQERTRYVGEHVRDESRRVKQMKEVLLQLVGRCGGCWVKSSGVESDHNSSECRRLDELMRKEYTRVRERLRYEENSCCFICSRPTDWCEEYRNGEICRAEDLIIPICLAGWWTKEVTQVIVEIIGQSFNKPDDYIRWLGRARVVHGIKATNALAVFDTVIHHLSIRRSQTNVD
jgi:superfamily II DNA helicase RecQ